MSEEIIAWDLSDLYLDVNDPQIKTDMKDIEKLAEDFNKKVKGNINNPNLKPEQLEEWFKKHEDIHEKKFYLYLFSSLLYSTTSLNDGVKNLYSQVQEFNSKINEQTLFFHLELNTIPEEKYKGLLASPDLKNYKHDLEFNRKQKPHQLSEQFYPPFHRDKFLL